jgi:adenosylcobinamide-GDP ribazoletransferase
LTALPVERRAVVLVAVLALSRWAMVGAIVAFPPARPGGLGAAFRAGAKPWHAVVATVIVALVLVPVGWRGLAMLALAVLGLVIVGLRIRHSVGGLTGDSYGAINEVVMVLGLLGALAAAPW